eukprot:s9660_g1.t1
MMAAPGAFPSQMVSAPVLASPCSGYSPPQQFVLRAPGPIVVSGGVVQSLRSPAAPSGAPPRPGVQIQQVPFATPSIPRPVSMPAQTPDLHPDLAVAMDLAKKSQSTKDGRDGAYRCFMESLETWGFLAQLPLDAAGVLHVAAPFCHDFFEAPHLLPFLASRFLRPGGARALEVRGPELSWVGHEAKKL